MRQSKLIAPALVLTLAISLASLAAGPVGPNDLSAAGARPAQASATPPGPRPTPTRVLVGGLCPSVARYVPNAEINRVAFNPETVSGWGMVCNPNLPIGPFNGMRSWLNLRTPSMPWHPLFNSVYWACGCS